MFQHILASFLATKLIEKWLTVFRCFNRYWPFFWQQNPLKKIDSFSDVSPDFGHFSSDKTHWKKLTVFRCFNGFWPFLWRRTPLKKMTAFQMFQQILAIFSGDKTNWKNDSFSDVSTDFGHFLATKPINTFSASYENTRSKRGFRTFLTFAALDIFLIEIECQNTIVSKRSESDGSKKVSNFLVRLKLTEWERFKVLKILSENRWFSENRLPVNVLRNDSFLYVSTDFDHFYGDKTNWKKLTVFQMIQ